MEIKDQLLHLVRLQRLVLDTRAAHAVVEGAPARLEEIEQRFRERNAEFVAVKDRYDALEADERERSAELQVLQEQRNKFTEDRKRVQNEREYAAILKEIDAVEARIAEHEEAILADLEELESVRTELKDHEEHIKTERALVETESEEVKQATRAARETIERLTTERTERESELPELVVKAVHRLEAGRGGIFLSRAEEGICQSCYVRVRLQVFQEIKLAVKIHACGSCKRLLYHDDSVEQAADSPDDSADSGPVEAVNGGAV